MLLSALQHTRQADRAAASLQAELSCVSTCVPCTSGSCPSETLVSTVSGAPVRDHLGPAFSRVDEAHAVKKLNQQARFPNFSACAGARAIHYGGKAENRGRRFGYAQDRIPAISPPQKDARFKIQDSSWASAGTSFFGDNSKRMIS